MKKVIFALVALAVCANALEFKPMKPIVVDHSIPKVINGQIVWVLVGK